MDWKQYFRSIPRRIVKFAALLALASPCLAGDRANCPDNHGGCWNRFCYYHCHWFWECCHGPYGNPRTHEIPYGTPGSCPPHGPTFGYYAPMWQPWPECYSEVEVVEPSEEVPGVPAMPEPIPKAPQQSQRMNSHPKTAARSAEKIADTDNDWTVERLPASTPVANSKVVAPQVRQVVKAAEASLTETPRPRVLLAQPQIAQSQPATPQATAQQVADQHVGPIRTNFVSLAPDPPALPAPKPVATAPAAAQSRPATLRPVAPTFSSPKATLAVKPNHESSQSNSAPVGRMILK